MAKAQFVEVALEGSTERFLLNVGEVLYVRQAAEGRAVVELKNGKTLGLSYPTYGQWRDGDWAGAYCG
ncbi:MAG: hypothetical protein ACE5I3_05790 [Phycisphaerae bacterium]